LDLRHVRPVDPGDLCEPVAEAADRHAEDAVTGRQGVDDRGLEPARTRAREHDDVVRRPEERLHPLEDAAEHRAELGAAVIDHLAATGLADGRRQGGRAGDPEIRFKAVHWSLLEGAGSDAGWAVTGPPDGRRSARIVPVGARRASRECLRSGSIGRTGYDRPRSAGFPASVVGDRRVARRRRGPPVVNPAPTVLSELTPWTFIDAGSIPDTPVSGSIVAVAAAARRRP